MQQVERVVSVVHEIYAVVVRSEGKSKERTATGSGRIDVLDGHLFATRPGFDYVSIPRVDRKDVAVGRDRQAQRLIQGAQSGYGGAVTSTGHAEECVRN